MVKIITDSAADLNSDYRERYGITAVPLSVIFGEEVFEDEVDITREEFYEKLKTSEHHPTTSHPMPVKYRKYFEEALKGGEEVIHLAISSKISGCFDSAGKAAQDIGDPRLHIFDTSSVSLGTGLLAIEAAKMAKLGHSAEEIIKALEELKTRIVSYIAVGKVKYLHRSGRMTMSKRILVDILDIKPILMVRTSGIVEVVGGVRGEKKALKHITEKALKKADDFSKKILAVGFTGVSKMAEEVISLLTEKVKLGEVIVFEASPVIGSHVGPGCAGIFYIE